MLESVDSSRNPTEDRRTESLQNRGATNHGRGETLGQRRQSLPSGLERRPRETDERGTWGTTACVYGCTQIQSTAVESPPLGGSISFAAAVPYT